MSVNDYDHELCDLIAELVAEGELEEGTAAYGIALQVVDLGYESLSDKQKYVYDKHVIPLLVGHGRQQEMNDRIRNAPD